MKNTTASPELTVLMKADYETALARVVDALKREVGTGSGLAQGVTDHANV